MKENNQLPVRVMHPNGLLPLQHSGFMGHYTGFMERRLAVK